MKKDSRLDEILLIEDREKRMNDLTHYAKELKINPGKSRNEQGEIDEDELTVLIYDAVSRNINAKNQIIGLLIGGVIILIVMSGFIFVIGMFFRGAS